MSMNHFLKSLLLALLVTASASAAELRWSGAVSDDFMTAGNWTIGTTGVPSTNPPVANDVCLVQNLGSQPHLRGSCPVIRLDVGITNVDDAFLYIEDGAEITGLTNYAYHLMPRRGAVYQSGGIVNASYNVWLHQGRSSNQGTGIYEMTGGTFSMPSTRTLSFLNRPTGTAHASLKVLGGTFTNLGWHRPSDGSPWATLAMWDITVRNTGTLVYRWNKATTIAAVTATTQNLRTGDPKQGLFLTWSTGDSTQFTNYITTNGGFPYSGQTLTVKAKYGVSTPLYPLDGQAVAPGSTILQWKNSAPYFDGTTMTRYVRLKVLGPTDVNETTGIYADPNGDSYPIIAGPLTADEPNIVFTAVYGENYRWRVDSVDPGIGNGDANYPKTIPSPAQVVVCKNQAAVVTIPTTATTPIGLRTGQAAWTTTATAKDDGLPIGGPALTFAWTQVSGPAVTINNAATATPSVTFTAANTYTFRCSVSDSDLIGTADVAVTVYADVCAATKARTGYTAYVGDLNADCWVSFADVALMASNWSTCNSLDPADPACTGL